MSKSSKTKNPCKICLRPVTQKTGLKCQGFCSSWIHFGCINYTPGKIKDIAGLLKVNCPCPDCESTKAKELYTNAGFQCGKSSCPAKKPPMCDDPNCVVKGIGVGTRTAQSSQNVTRVGYSIADNTSMVSTAGDTDWSHNKTPMGQLEADIDQVCNTVGQLTQQMNELMMNLKKTVASGIQSNYYGVPASIPHPNPKPCHCPTNKLKK